MSDRISTARTAGGIPVTVERIPDSRSAGFMIGVATGSRDEVPGIFGLSHLLEHTVFRETTSMDSYQMAKVIEGAGGEMNAFTAREMTAFYAITISETARTAMKVVGDIVANPLINEEDTELEKRIVLQELSMIESEPDVRIHDLFESQIWRGHPLSQDEGGDKETVSRLTSQDLRAYYEEKYRIPNLAVYAAGDVDLDATVAWAEDVLDPRSGGRRNDRSAPPVPEAGYRYVEGDSDHLQVAMGFPGFPASHPDRTTLSMLSAVLGMGTSSRLFQSVRERKALVYSVYSTVSQESDASSMATYMSCTEGYAEEAMTTVTAEFGRLLADGLEEGELERAKRMIKGAYVRTMESTEHRLYRMCVNNMLDGSVETQEEHLERIDAVTEDDVMRVAEEVLRPERLNVVVLGRAGERISSMDVSDLSFRPPLPRHVDQVQDRAGRAVHRGLDLRGHGLSDGADVLHLYRHEPDGVGHELGIHLPAYLERRGQVHVMGGCLGHLVQEVLLGHQDDRARPILPGLDRVHYDGVRVPLDHREYVQPADGLLEAVHVRQAKVLYGLGHPEPDGVVAHYRAAEPHHGDPTVTSHDGDESFRTYNGGAGGLSPRGTIPLRADTPPVIPDHQRQAGDLQAAGGPAGRPGDR